MRPLKYTQILGPASLEHFARRDVIAVHDKSIQTYQLCEVRIDIKVRGVNASIQLQPL